MTEPTGTAFTRPGMTIENARLAGANGVVAMRFDSSEIGQQLTEIVAYGTAVITRASA